MIFAKLMVKSKLKLLFSPAVTSLRRKLFLGHRMSAERNIELRQMCSVSDHIWVRCILKTHEKNFDPDQLKSVDKDVILNIQMVSK